MLVLSINRSKRDLIDNKGIWMIEITHYDEAFQNKLEENAIDLELDKHGFNYVRDDKRVDLDDSTIFNILLKNKYFRGIELKKEWITLRTTIVDGIPYIISNDIRHEFDIPNFYELNSPVDNDLIKFVKRIVNPYVALKNEKRLDSLKEIILDVFEDMGINSEMIRENPSHAIIELKVKIAIPFELTVFFNIVPNKNTNTNNVFCSVDAPNKDNYFHKMYIVHEINELHQLMLDDYYELKSKLKKALDNYSMDELMMPVNKNDPNYLRKKISF